MADTTEQDPREGAGSDVSRRRQMISGANAATVIAATIGIVFLANAIVSQFSRLRIDMTENNRFTLSEASKKVAADFDNLEIKAFLSANMPPPMHTMERRVRDILSEYKAAAGGDVEVDIYMPGSEQLTDKEQKKLEQDAKSYGCEKVGLRSGGRNEVSVRTVYKCVAFVKGGREQEVIKNLSAGGRPGQMNFEYEFTKALMNLQGREARKVAFVKGFGGIADRRGFTQKIGQRFDQLFDGLITATSLDLSKKDTSIPEDVSALILLNPSKKVGDTAKFKIDQFLQQGGSVGWYQSSTGIDQKMRRRMRGRAPGGFRKPLSPNLRGFFADYGLKLRKDTVLDRQNGMVAVVPYKGKRALARHPATFTTSRVNQNLPFTKNFGTIGLPAPSSIQVQATAKDNEKLKVYRVIRSEDSARRRTKALTDLSLSNLKKPSDAEKKGPFTLAAALQGSVPSYFADKKAPKGMSKKEKSKSSKATSSRILIVGAGSLLRPQSSIGYNRRLAGLGQRFFFASLEWLAQDSALAQIRGKSLPRLINEVEPSTRRWIQFINIAGVPVFFALLGVLMMLRRRMRRNRIRSLDWS